MALLRIVLLLACVASARGAATPPRTMSTFERFTKSDASGTAWWVRVPDEPLVFTAQVTAERPGGEARAEASTALSALAAVLREAGSDLARVVRLNAYVGDDASVPMVEAAVAAQFGSHPVACTLTRTPLVAAGARVAFEAVARSSRTPAAVEILERAAVLPEGGKIFISGQVERGTDLASGATATMAGLYRSLAHLGLGRRDVVQVKVFFRPSSDPGVAASAVAASFEGEAVPPVILQEWMSDTWTEIELVAAARTLPARAGEAISHAWLPWLTASPRYCNVAHVMPGTPLIFIGAIDGGEGDARSQMKTIFERLGSILFDAGSSYRNLAKATYYLQDAAARTLLNDIRGVYYDPTRAPAASALGVRSFGHPGRAAALDMIAVPVK